MMKQHYQCTAECFLRLCMTKPTRLDGFIANLLDETRNIIVPIAWVKKENEETVATPELFHNQIP